MSRQSLIKINKIKILIRYRLLTLTPKNDDHIRLLATLEKETDVNFVDF